MNQSATGYARKLIGPEPRKIKESGGNFEDFQERKAQRTYGKGYQSLSTKQKTDLWRGIVESSGRDNPKVSAMMKNLGRVGRGLWVSTAALAAYNVLESDDKLKIAGKEVAKIGGGVLGGITGGAVAGWICGPGAPVCSGVGILVGGVAGAMGVDVGLDFLSGQFEDDKE